MMMKKLKAWMERLGKLPNPLVKKEPKLKGAKGVKQEAL